MATKFKDGLVSGDEIKSEGDIQAISGKSIIAASTNNAKKISMHHDAAGGHIDATEKLEIDSPSTIVKANEKNILSGDSTETTLYHSNDGSDRIVTTSTGITVYGSDGVTSKKFKFPILEDDDPIAAGSTADTDFALIQAQKIGTDADETSVLDFTIGDNPSIDEFRFRFDPSDGSGVNSGNEYSLVTIGANTDGCTVMDLTDSHELNADTDANTSEVKAGFFRGKADTVAALTDLTTNNLSEGTNKYFTQARARGSISVTLASTSDAQYWPANGEPNEQLGDFCNELIKVVVNSATNPTEFAAWANATAFDGFKYGDLNKSGSITSDDTLLAAKLAADGAYADVDAAVIERWVDIIEPHLKSQSWFVESLTAQLPIGLLSYDSSAGVLKYKPSDLSSFLTSSSVPVASTTVVGGMKLTSDVDQTIPAETVTSEANRTYAVQLNSDNNAVVNVPWTDNQDLPQYGTATSDAAGLVKIGYTPPTESTRKYAVELSNEQMYVNVPWTDTVPNAYAQVMNQDVRNTDDVEFNKLTANSDVEVNGNFHVIDGNIVTTGNVTAFSSTISDKRLKSDITNISKALDKVGKINGVTFVRNHNGENAAGIIAQEVMEVLPEAVRSQKLPLHTDNSDEEYYVVEYDALTGLLVEAIKELKAEIDELKGGK